jgi:hypothetical protein
MTNRLMLYREKITAYCEYETTHVNTYCTSNSTVFLILKRHVRWIPCHHAIARPQVADGEDVLQVWRVAANILNKQSRTADKGWYSSLEVGRGANNSP